jgi:hypothetical protein
MVSRKEVTWHHMRAVELTSVYPSSSPQWLISNTERISSEAACLPGIVLSCSPRMAVNHVCLGREMYRAAANLAGKRADKLFPAQVSPTENTRAVRTMSTRSIDTSCGVAEFRRVDRSHIAKNPVYPRIPEGLATF